MEENIYTITCDICGATKSDKSRKPELRAVVIEAFTYADDFSIDGAVPVLLPHERKHDICSLDCLTKLCEKLKQEIEGEENGTN